MGDAMKWEAAVLAVLDEYRKTWTAPSVMGVTRGVVGHDGLAMADEIVRLRAAVERVRALHGAEPDDPHWCYECNETMPCPTLRALDGEP